MDSIVGFTPPADRVPTTARHSLRSVTALRSAASALARSNAPLAARFWRCGDGLVLPYGPPATSWTPSCRKFASFHAAKAAHRELLEAMRPVDLLPQRWYTKGLRFERMHKRWLKTLLSAATG